MYLNNDMVEALRLLHMTPTAHDPVLLHGSGHMDMPRRHWDTWQEVTRHMGYQARPETNRGHATVYMLCSDYPSANIGTTAQSSTGCGDRVPSSAQAPASRGLMSSRCLLYPGLSGRPMLQNRNRSANNCNAIPATGRGRVSCPCWHVPKPDSWQMPQPQTLEQGVPYLPLVQVVCHAHAGICIHQLCR